MTDSTPQGTLKAYFIRQKRPAPSTGSSSEPISQVKKSIRIADGDLSDVRVDLSNVFDMDSANAEEILSHFDQQMEECFKQFRDEINSKLENVVKKLTDRVLLLEQQVQALKATDEKRQREYKEMKISLNRQIQYSMKDNLRFFGIKEKAKEDCRREVCQVIANKLKVPTEVKDMSIAHRLPKPPRQEHKPIIAKFKDMTHRLDILKKRRALKGCGISIQEDMTTDNMNLVKEAERSRLFESVWFSNGRVRAKDKKGTIHKLELFDDFAKLV